MYWAVYLPPVYVALYLSIYSVIYLCKLSIVLHISLYININFKRHISLDQSLFLCPFVIIPIYPSVCLSVCLLICLIICLFTYASALYSLFFDRLCSFIRFSKRNNHEALCSMDPISGDFTENRTPRINRKLNQQKPLRSSVLMLFGGFVWIQFAVDMRSWVELPVTWHWWGP